MISFCIPIVRPEKAQRVIEAIHWDYDIDTGGNYEILAEEDKERIGCPKMLKRLVDKSKGDLVVFLGDDTIPQPGFLKAALEAMSKLPDDWGLVGLNSQTSRHAAHFLADKRMLDLLPDREFFNTAYKHCFCDNELTDIATEHGRFVFCDDAKVVHDHPIFTGQPEDEDYKRVYQKQVWDFDRSLYIRRKRERLQKFAIGFPLVDPTVHVNFFTSFICMEKPADWILLFPTFPHGPFVSSLPEARNNIVQQAQWEGCSQLFMCDTDQVYPADTFKKLRSHGKDICGTRVHKRYPPFTPIFLRGDIGSYEYVSDEEMFSGKLVEVDATGTGALLLNMEIFDSIPEPWFQFDTAPDGRPVGEDIYFCSQARKQGFQIFVDTSIEVEHLSTIAIGRGLYEFFRAFNKKGGNKEWLMQ